VEDHHLNYQMIEHPISEPSSWLQAPQQTTAGARTTKKNEERTNMNEYMYIYKKIHAT